LSNWRIPFENPRIWQSQKKSGKSQNVLKILNILFFNLLKNSAKDGISNTIPVIKLFEQIGNLFPEAIHDEYNNSPTVPNAHDRKTVLSKIEQDEGRVLNSVP